MGYSTQRLEVLEISVMPDKLLRQELLLDIQRLLTPAVTYSLSPYFQNIQSSAAAESWLKTMLKDSQLFAIYDKASNLIIGFFFSSIGKDKSAKGAHIGYLLGEEYWGQGLASEMLRGFISYARQSLQLHSLIGGVEKNNPASSRLLIKLGFKAQPSEEGQSVIFYALDLTDSAPRE
ncbi:GNAT family N-acetyltransferase [Marinomonas sp. C2222]|uniref:GNAT family N-acetyltransferase n=1 Tax=Marinomonas sargassi TaxID=2984494 RepID=A0ABT2YU20_9GAMM|nr:GNAT family N-acetyltransferase [Marinomonas sargassi]MCV2403393.1 GNAT family N-acetyltransferase [Marinomonas sargassi]